MFIIVRGKKINKEQAYDILLDFDIKNIDDIIKNLNNNCKKSVLELRKKCGHY